MTREQAREAANVMLEWADGKEVQCKRREAVVWVQFESGENPAWNWDIYEYRLKPTPVLRPWTADEVPLGAWVRLKGINVTRSMIVSVQHVNLRIMFQDYEHSTDGGLNWKPCGVEEVGK